MLELKETVIGGWWWWWCRDLGYNGRPKLILNGRRGQQRLAGLVIWKDVINSDLAPASLHEPNANYNALTRMGY
jgi:hypothetical protein